MKVFRYFSVPLVSLAIFAAVVFPALETGVVLAANPSIVNVKQQVGTEISLSVGSGSLTLSPTILGLSGGTGNASTVVTVVTTNAAGYNILFQASTTQYATSAMQGITPALGPGYIKDYVPAVGNTPETWIDTTAGQASQYGFGITNGSLSTANSAAGYGTCAAADSCFAKAPTSTTKQIVYVGLATPGGGDTFTLKFRVHIPANSSPLVPQDWYSATSTLTAITN